VGNTRRFVEIVREVFRLRENGEWLAVNVVGNTIVENTRRSFGLISLRIKKIVFARAKPEAIPD